MHAKLPRGVQGSVGVAIHTGLLALCSSTYLHVHTAHVHAPHARRYDPPLAGGTPLSPHDPTGDVGVDGSYHTHTGTAAAGVAYLVRGQDGLQEVHITNATFAGAQSAQEEVAALALSRRLAPLQRVQALNIGWDCLTPLRHVWSAVQSTFQPQDSGHALPGGEQHPTPRNNASAGHDPQMARALALLRLREASGQTTTLRHQKAHSMDAHLGPLLLPVLRTGNDDNHGGIFVIDSLQLSTLSAKATAHQRREDGSPVGQAGALATVLNACADWAGKQVTVRESPAHHHLDHSKWPSMQYSIVTPEGAHINTEPNCLRKAATARAARGVLEDYVRDNARSKSKYATRMTSAGIWMAESTAGLRLPGLRPEGGATLYLRSMHNGHTCSQQRQGSSLPRPSDHQDASTGTNPGHQVPPVPAGRGDQPRRRHRTAPFPECPSADADRGALKSAIVSALGCVSRDQTPTEDAVQVAADAITAEDFYAGQVPSRVKELLDDSCRRKPWKNEKGELIRYPVGTIHGPGRPLQ
jgi:hypothetical protein